MTFQPRRFAVGRPIRPALMILALGVLVACYSVVDYFEMRRLTDELEHIRDTQLRADEPVTIEPKPNEAGHRYIAAAILALGASDSIFAATNPVDRWLSGKTQPGPDFPRWTADLQRLVDDHSAALSLVDEALDKPFKGYPAGIEFPYRSVALGWLVRLMSARTFSLSLKGDGEGSVNSALAELRLREILGVDSTWIVRSEVPIAAVLSLGQPSREDLARLHRGFPATYEADMAVASLMRQRAQYALSIWRRYYDRSSGSYELPSRSIIDLVLRPVITHQLVSQLNEWEELIKTAATPWPNKSNTIIMARAKYGHRRGRSWGSIQRDIPFAAFSLAVQVDPIAQRRAIVTAVAVERFRRDHGGSLPDKLTELVPSYVAAISVDPVTGEALRYRRDAISYSIYSVGNDREDNGGDFSPQIPTIANRQSRSADIGIRVTIQ